MRSTRASTCAHHGMLALSMAAMMCREPLQSAQTALKMTADIAAEQVCLQTLLCFTSVNQGHGTVICKARLQPHVMSPLYHTIRPQFQEYHRFECSTPPSQAGSQHAAKALTLEGTLAQPCHCTLFLAAKTSLLCISSCLPFTCMQRMLGESHSLHHALAACHRCSNLSVHRGSEAAKGTAAIASAAGEGTESRSSIGTA